MRVPRRTLTINALRTASRLRSPTISTRTYASRARNGTGKPLPVPASPMSEPPTDPRPQWMFSTAAFLRIVLVPVGFAYAIFIHDFGEEDHVFMPPRRWLQKQKESFFSLTPAEQGLITEAEIDDGKRES